MRLINFSAGPAMLPASVLDKAKLALLEADDLGMGILEVGHRTSYVQALLEDTQGLLRDLIAIPEAYEILFTTCPSRAHYAFLPMNCLKRNACYAITGIWSQLAYQEAQKYGPTQLCYQYAKKPDMFLHPDKWHLDEQADYLHIVENETIQGIEFPDTPRTTLPLMADLTSNLLSKRIDISNYAMIYAGLQKNLGPAGLSLMIGKPSYFQSPMDITPNPFVYKELVKHQSLNHTINIFGIYVLKLMLEWVKNEGGIDAFHQENLEKSALLYSCIDASTLFYNNIPHSHRSRMNVVFHLSDYTLEQTFIEEAKQLNLIGLKGHAVLGGMRVSLYNAIRLEDVEALVRFMKVFEHKHCHRPK